MKIFKPQFAVTLAIALAFVFPSISYASTNITATSSWGNILGWVNFGPTNGNVTVTNSSITGYVWSATYGWINLNPTNGGVINDGQGNLSGEAWGQDTGWINFAGVFINSSGVFTGQTASSPIAGVINFSCTNCLVTTSWRPGQGTSTATSTMTGSSPVSTSGGGSIALGGFSPVPLITSTTSTDTNPVPFTGTSQPISPQPSSSGNGSVSTATNNFARTHVQTSSKNFNISTSSESVMHKWQNILKGAITNAPFPARVIGGASLVLLLILILWRLIAL